MSARTPGTGAGPDSSVPLTRVSSPVLAARVDELDQLLRAVTALPVFVLVEGEAGVGKTRLVSELTAHVSGAGVRVLTGHCHALQEPFPLGPVVEAVRALGDGLGALSLSPLAGALRPVFPELAWRLPVAPAPLGDARMERHRLWQALVEVLSALGPALLVLEDLHWSDDVTPSFLAFLASQQPPQLGVILTARSEDPTSVSPLGSLASCLPSSASVLRIPLSPLAPSDVKVMVGAILDTDVVSDEFAAYLHERTAGIPFAVEEVLRLLVDRKDIVRRKGSWARRVLDDVEVPAAVRDSILQRISTLATDARAVAEAAAVMAEPAPDNVLRSVAGLPAARARRAIADAVSAGILQPAEEGYACRHALAAQAIYDAVAVPRRAPLHERAAVALESEQHPGVALDPRLAARLAHHWRQAGDPGRWVTWAEQAASLAVALGDSSGAATLLLDALVAAGVDAETRGRLGLALCATALDGLRQSDAISAVRGLLVSDAVADDLRGRLRAGLGALLHQAGDASAARGQFALAAPELQGEPRGLAHVMLALALPWVVEGDLDDHLSWLARASTLADQLALDPEASLMLRGDRAAILLAVGDGSAWSEIPPPPEANSTLAVQQERARLCTNLAINAFHLGHDERAASLAAEGVRICETTGYRRMMPALRTAQVLLALTAGKWDGLAAAAADILDQQPDMPSVVQLSTVRYQLALAAGQVDDIEGTATDTLAQARRCGAIATAGMAAATLARLRLARGDPESALRPALATAEIVAAKGIWVWAAPVLPVTVAALVKCDRAREAAEWCARFAAGLLGRDGPAAAAALVVCLGIVDEYEGRLDEAADRFAEAEVQWHRLGRPYEAAQAAENRARTLLAADDGGPSRRSLAEQIGRSALDDYRRLGASWDEARVVRLLRQHDMAIPYSSRRGRRGYGEQLSPREQEVVDLAATGLSSTRIAARLFLSPRTVDHHLARALRKLGLATRRELVHARDAAEPREKNR